MNNRSTMYKRHRFPPEIIQHVVPQGQASRSGSIKFGSKYAKRLLRVSGSEPRRIVTDKLRSYCVAHRELIPDTTDAEYVPPDLESKLHRRLPRPEQCVIRLGSIYLLNLIGAQKRSGFVAALLTLTAFGRAEARRDG